jgi:hypothetical protein
VLREAFGLASREGKIQADVNVTEYLLSDMINGSAISGILLHVIKSMAFTAVPIVAVSRSVDKVARSNDPFGNVLSLQQTPISPCAKLPTNQAISMHDRPHHPIGADIARKKRSKHAKKPGKSRHNDTFISCKSILNEQLTG